MKPERPKIKIGTLEERLRASANVPLEKALEGVRSHGPEPTRPNPSIAALEVLEKSKPKSSPEERPNSSTETEPNTTFSSIPDPIA